MKNALCLFALLLGLAACAPVGSAPTSNSTIPPIIEPATKTTVPATPIATSTAMPSETTTLAQLTLAETLPAQDVWQTSPDGHLEYNDAQLYGGLFTIDKAHPEYAQKYWEDTIRGLWNLNSVSKNTAFLSQFPTADALVKYLNDGGGPINNLWIPAIYPDASGRFLYQATLEPLEGSIDLSQIAIAINKPTREEIYNFSPNYATGTKFISYYGGAERVHVESVNVNGKNILQFTFCSDILVDTTYSPNKTEYVSLALSDEKTPQDNLRAANQLIWSWSLEMQMPETFGNGAKAWITNNLTHPILNTNTYNPPLGEFNAITTLDGPLAIR